MIQHVAKVLTYDFLSKLVVGLCTLAIIRFMEPEAFATYSFALSLLAVLTQTLSPAFNRVYIIGFEKLGISKNLGAFLGIQILLAFGLAGILFSFVELNSLLRACLLLLTVAYCSHAFVRSLFQRFLKFSRFGLVDFLRGALFAFFLILLIIFYQEKIAAEQVLGAQALALLLVVLPVLFNQSIFKDLLKIKAGFQYLKKIFVNEYKYLFAYHAVVAIYAQVDILMLKSLSSSFQLATYSSAFRYYGFLIMGLSAVHVVILPVLQKAEKLEEVRTLFKKHYKLVAGFIPVVLISMYLCQWIFPWIDGGKYPTAIMIYRILAISAIFSFTLSPHVNLILKFERFSFLFWQIFISLFINIALNALLIPAFGSTGAALATLFGYLVINFGTYIYSRRLYRELR